MNRPAWNDLMAKVRTGEIQEIVVWRLDRLGRTASGLTSLFDELRSSKVNLVSIKDGLDLETSAGRLMANVLASVAQYDNEVRAERIRAGQEAAKARGVKWGGSKPGIRKKVKANHLRSIEVLYRGGQSTTEISKSLNLSRPTVSKIIKELKSNEIAK